MKVTDFVIHRPHEEGLSYGLYYKCTECGNGWMNMEDADDWNYCPHCGANIIETELLNCYRCKYIEDNRCINPASFVYQDLLDELSICDQYKEELIKDN